MYAVIRTGGKQYTVRPGDTVRVERLNKELGSEFDLNEVLLIGGEKVLVGEPLVSNAKVTVVVTQQAKSPKVIIFKKKRRQGYRRLRGHRQLFTELFVKSIKAPSGEVAEAEKEAHVIDPVKREERLAKLIAQKLEAKASGVKVEKKVAKKAAPKKAASKAKKSGGAKSGGKTKKAGTKKTAK